MAIIKTPVYNYLMANLFLLRLKACFQILTVKRSIILETVAKQQKYGLAKYGILIDSNKNFDAKTYSLEELADYLVYTSYLSVYENRN